MKIKLGEVLWKIFFSLFLFFLVFRGVLFLQEMDIVEREDSYQEYAMMDYEDYNCLKLWIHPSAKDIEIAFSQRWLAMDAYVRYHYDDSEIIVSEIESLFYGNRTEGRDDVIGFRKHSIDSVDMLEMDREDNDDSIPAWWQFEADGEGKELEFQRSCDRVRVFIDKANAMVYMHFNK